MHELIFKNFRQLSIEKLKTLGQQAGLDPAALEQAIRQEASKAVIDKDMQDARKASVNATPTVFINGKRLPRRDFATMKRMIDEEINKKKSASASAAGR